MKNGTRLGFLLVAASFCLTASASVTSEKTLLTNAHKLFQDLLYDIPFDELLDSRDRDHAKNSYRTALERLSKGTVLLESDRNKAAGLIGAALYGLRRVGLLVPFHKLENPSRNETITAYLTAEDSVQEALNRLNGPPAPNLSRDWNDEFGLHWRWLETDGSWGDSDGRCRAFDGQGRNWRLPLVGEMTRATEQLKSPTKNPAFGIQAAQFGKVWSADSNPQQPGQYLAYDFQLGRAVPTDSREVLTTLCVWQDTAAPLPTVTEKNR